MGFIYEYRLILWSFPYFKGNTISPFIRSTLTLQAIIERIKRSHITYHHLGFHARLQHPKNRGVYLLFGDFGKLGMRMIKKGGYILIQGFWKTNIAVTQVYLEKYFEDKMLISAQLSPLSFRANFISILEYL